MAFDVQAVLSETAFLGNDDDNVDFPTAQIHRFVNEALTVLVRRRPDLLLQADGTLATPSTVSALTDTVELDDEWKPAVVAYFLYKGFSRDARDAKHQQLASQYKGEFEELIGTV